MPSAAARGAQLPSAISGLERLGAYLEELPGGRADTDAGAEEAPMQLRYRRGDSWQLGRVRNVTAWSIGVACGCPPRKDDVIEIELRVGDVEVVVDAVVLAVTHPDTAEVIGAYGFGARFVGVDRYTHHRLRRILTAVGAEEECFAQPPRRRFPRYPVHWPVEICIGAWAKEMHALDLSERGVFVACRRPPAPRGATIRVIVHQELEGAPIRARARVTRMLDASAATHHRASPGFGLEIISMRRAAASQFAALVDRVARRAGHPVLVAADPERLPPISAALSAVGYPVSGVTTARALLRGPDTTLACADLAILDASLDKRNRGWINSARSELLARGIRSLILRGGRASEAWRLADRIALR